MDEEGQMEFLFEGGNIQKQTSLLICLDELAQRRRYLMGHTQSLGSLWPYKGLWDLFCASISINELKEVMSCTHTTFADDTRLVIWATHSRAELPFRVTQTSWGNGQGELQENQQGDMQNNSLGRNNSWKQFCRRPSCLWTVLGKWPRCLWAASHEGASSILGCRSKDVARKLRNYPLLINGGKRMRDNRYKLEGERSRQHTRRNLSPWGPNKQGSRWFSVFIHEGLKDPNGSSTEWLDWTSGLILLG